MGIMKSRSLFGLLGIILLFIVAFNASYGQNLSISKTGTASASPGGTISYTITYSNTGSGSGNNIIITDYLPAPTLYTYSSSSPAGNYNSISNTITWTSTQIAQLASLAPGTYTLTVNLIAGTSGSGYGYNPTAYYMPNSSNTISNYAGIKSDEVTTEKYSPTVNTSVTQSCSSTISYSGGGEIKSTHDSYTTYLMSITNTGNTYDNFNISITGQTEFVQGGNTFSLVYSFTNLSGTAITQTGFIAPGQVYNFYMKLTLPKSVANNQTDITDITSTSTVCTGAQTNSIISTISNQGAGANTNISITKSVSPNPITAGLPVTYNITVSCSSNQDAIDVKVDDFLPSGLTFNSASNGGTLSSSTVSWPIFTLTKNTSKTLSVTVTPSCNCFDSFTNTATAITANNDIDLSDNSTSLTTNSIDTTAPVLAGIPANITVQCSSVPAAALIGTDVTATDNCDASVNITYSEVRTDGTCPDSYTLTRTWTATDNCGNASTGSQLITVQDTTAPVLAGIPANITVQCSSVPAAAVIGTDVTATDNCDSSVDIVFAEVRTDGTCPDTYTLTRTWTATDNCGNASTGSQLITIQDTTAPVLAGIPANITVQCSSVPAAALIGTDVTATDNCDSSVDIVFAETRTDGTCPDTYTLTRTWTATDNCGNASTGSQLITVQDTTAPVLAGIPANITVQCSSVPAAALIGTDVTATDNCDASVNITYSEVRTDGTCPDSYTLTRTWTATDNCGNSSSSSQLITIQDTTAPVLAGIPANITVQCSSVPAAALIGTDVTATDNCDASVNITYSEVRTDGTCPDSYTLTRTWTATDNCGNSSSSSQLITIQDTTAPVLAGIPANITVQCSSVPAAALIGTDVTATDNCDASVNITYSEVRTDGTCPDSYTLTRTWTATDNCGNSSSSSQLITIQDTTAPVLAGIPANITVQCSSVPAAALIGTDVTATDNCDASVNITYSEVRTDGTCPDSYTLTRTWTATDNCGNASTGSQLITIQDTTAPVLAGIPANITVQCSSVPAAALIGTDVTATDNCDASVNITYSEVRTDGTCPDSYTLTRTWTATDNCGNASTGSQLITIQDTTAPVLAGIPANITVQCSSVPAAALIGTDVTATDNCDASVNITYSEVRTDGTCPDSYTLTRTWTATDNCGNSSSSSQLITIQDTTAPVLAGIPANITVQCSSVPAAALIGTDVTATDNCDASVSIVFAETRTDGTCPDTYTLTRTWTATDNCGNSSSSSQLITIQDTTAPVLAGIPANITVQCSSVPAAALIGTDVTATDNCDASVNITYSEVRTDGTCPDSYTLTRTWTATDNCGNSSSSSQLITIQDTTAPVLAGIPANITVQCSSVPAAALIGTDVTATDNCDASVNITYSEVRTDGTCPDSYTLTRTWTATDNCGNSSSSSQLITIQDTTAPVLAGIPANITVQCSSVPAAALIGTDVTATDNCDASVSIVFAETRTDGTCPDTYTLTRTWTATDNCGNSSSSSQLITIQDTTAPVLAGIPANITVQCSSVPAAALIGTDVTATDNCDASVSIVFAETRTDGTCPDTYTLTRTWTATDNCGNSSSSSQLITIQDTTAPVLAGIPANITVQCSSVPAAALIGTDVTATDNCDASVSIVFAETRTDGTCPDTYTLTRTWTATDNCGNSSSSSQLITIQDTTAPVLAGIPANITVQCSSVPAAALIGTDVTATDNCDASVNITYSEVRTDGTCPDSYTLTRTWTATDNCGNSSSSSQLITIQDTTAPVLAGIPANITVQCSSVPAAALIGTDVTATDNCDASVNITYSEVRTDGTCPDTYTLTRTWTATDNCGNSSSSSQLITIQDTTAPVLAGIPANITVQCSSVPAAALIGTDVTATDNCDASVSIVFAETRTDGTCPDTYTLTRTWTATDNCGNSSSSSQLITIQDTTAPVLAGIPANITVQCSSVPAAALIGTDVTATDNCDASVSIVFAETRTDGTCPDTYTLTRTWTATDNCGNSSSSSQLITIQDTTAPVLAGIPANITVQCSSVPAAALIGTDVTATDNCDASVNITYSEVRTDGTCPDSYTLTRTWTATDNCGNSSSSSQLITIQDTTAPVLAGIPANITVQCSSVPAAALIGTDVTATDNCDASVNITYSEVRTDGTCPDSYTLTRTWTATDNCGNSSSSSQLITIQDTTAPVLAGIPANITVQCSSVPAAALIGTDVTATDNCDASVNITYSEVRTDGTCPDSYTLTRTWTATDNCGNSSSSSQLITIQDTTAPVLAGIPANITVQCSSVPAAALIGTDVTATDNCDASVNITYSEVRTDGTCPDSYTLTRTWTATDNCGNASTGSQLITIQDTTAPVLAGIPANITVQCSSVPAAALIGTDVTATDNCDASVSIVFAETRTDGTCPDTYTLTRTWTATDNCGNSSSSSQLITIQDTTAPVLAGIPANITVQCSSVPAAALIGTDVTATDNCDASVNITYSEVRTDGTCPDSYTLTRTWTATDNCGNASTGSQLITIQDTTAPVLAGIPANITVQCSSVPAAALIGTDVTATDNCDASVNITYSEVRTDGTCPDSYTLTRTWTATDNCGNASTGSQLITIQDTTAPVLAGIPANITVQCSSVPAAALIGTDVTATDNCDASVNITYSEVRTDGTCPDSYTLTRTWTATDNCGNSSSSSQLITIQDTTAPVLAGIPANITVQCSSVPAAALIGTDVTATDNCDASVSIVFAETRTDGTCPDTYTLTRTWTATDNCGNSSSSSQLITIQDTTAPVLAGIPANITVQCSSVPAAALIGTDVTATDNCDASVNITYSEVRTDGTCPDTYTLTRTWTATDNCGNSSSSSQLITIQDTTAPVLAGIPANITVQCSSVPAAALIGTDVTATDNCDASVNITYSEVRTDGTCPDSYTLTRTWTATDNCGNASTGSQLITIQDTTAPVLAGIPANITVQCSSVPAAALIGTDVTATDNCDASVNITYSEVRTDGTCPDSYTLTRTWTATDNCGNSSSSSQLITIQDTTAPVLAGIPANITVQCSSVPAAALIGTDVTATDNCDASVSIVFAETRTDGTCPDTYTLTRTWTATDNCGNSSSSSQLITIQDTTAPVLAGIPANITVQCSSVPAAALIGTDVTATDNCDASVSIVFAETRTDGTCPDTYTLTRTWTATDNCGNSSSSSQLITIQDTTAPVLAGIPANITVQCSSVPAAALIGTDVTATDNCDASVNITYSEVRTDGTCPDSYTLTRTWTATDNCGNSSSSSQLITIQDTTAPVLAGIPANITVQCSSVPAAALIGTDVTATDNCDASVNITYSEVRTDGTCPDSYTLTRTWTATDNCGNSSSSSQLITIQDTTAPVLAGIPANITVQCSSVPAAALIGTDVTATDNCDASVSIVFAETRTDGTCPDTYTLTRTWTATDNCGNSSSSSQLITIQDTTAPVLAGIPANITVQCSSVPAAALIGTDVTATDNCDASVSIVFAETRTDGTCPDTYTLTRTWTATDNCGNSSSSSQLITIQDTTAPVLAGIPANITVQCSSVPAAALIGTDVTATDNCDASVSIVFAETRTDGTCPDTYTLTRTWTATDNCGNSSSSSQLITIQDTTAPVLAGIPANITVQCSSVPAAALIGTDVTATDNCDASVNITYSEVRTDGTCPDSYTLTRTWTATDNCGNSSSSSQLITIQDTTAPVLAGIPANITVQCSSVPAAALIGTDVTATDNCDASVNITYSEVRTDGTCPDTYTLTRTWTATDNCGNSSSSSQLITIQDTTAPVLAGIPANITVQCSSVPAAALIGTDVTATDNCDASVSIVFAETRTDGTCPDTYTLTRTWTATDNCGNSSSSSQLITIQDTTAPVLAGIPANITVQCSSVPAAALIGTDVTATDNCDASVNITYSEVRTDGTCPDSYTLTRTWTATDNCGNASTGSQLITIQDTTAPVLAGIPANITVQCSSVPAAALIGTDVTATDNCDASVSIVFAETRTDGTCPDTYTLTRTWTATDNCGNSSSSSQLITIQDTTAPVLAGIPANITVQCSSVPAAALIGTDVTATDNCDASVNITYSEVRTDGTCPDSYTLTRTWTATDNCGNSSSSSQLITIQDTTAPVLAGIPANITVQCSSVPAAALIGTDVTATDNCDASVSIVFAETRTDGTCPDTYTLTRTWTATDNCGNSSSSSQLITVQDTTAPTFDAEPTAIADLNCGDQLPAQQTLSATDNCGTATVIASSVDPFTVDKCKGYSVTYLWKATDECGNASEKTLAFNILPDTTAPTFDAEPTAIADLNCSGQLPAQQTLSATDNCGTATVVASVDPFTVDKCKGYSVTYRWKATDECGNASEKTLAFNILPDTIKPVFSEFPTDTIVACSGIPQLAEIGTTVKATDNCNSIPVIVYNGETKTSGICPNLYIITRTWTATDECGNSSEKTQTITVKDLIAPVFVIFPEDETVECSDLLSEIPTVEVTDDCDTDVDIQYSEEKTNVICNYSYTLKRKWIATDDCGNKTEKIQSVAVRDTTSPVFDKKPGVISDINCNEDLPVQETLSSTDNCGSVNIVASVDNYLVDKCAGYVITYRWKAADECENTSEETISFNVLPDTQAPVFNSAPTAIADLNCGENLPVQETLTATDNCGTATVIASVDGYTVDKCKGYAITYRWTAIDDCGNKNVITQIFNVLPDIENPSFLSTAKPIADIHHNDPLPVQEILSATDNCGEAIVTPYVNPHIEDKCNGYAVTYRWEASDECGNTTEQFTTFNVLPDEEAPIFMKDPDPVADINSDDALPQKETLTANDDGEMLQIEATTDPYKEDRCNGYNITYRWSAVDKCGNLAEKTITFKVLPDTTPPVFEKSPSPISDIRCADELPDQETIKALDGPNEAPVNKSVDPYMADKCSGYTITYRWTAMDICSNTSIVTQSFNVLPDKEAPTFTKFPGDTLIPCDNIDEYLLKSLSVEAIDNCSGNIIIAEKDTTKLNGNCRSNYKIKRRWTATDTCGNFAEQFQMVTVTDSVAPKADPLIALGPFACLEDIPVPDTTMVKNITDNCSVKFKIQFISDFIESGCSGTMIRTYRLSDECDNFRNLTQEIIINDTIPPTADAMPVLGPYSCYKDRPAANLEDVKNVTDNCISNVTVRFISDSENPGCVGEVIRIYQLEDSCGNTIEIQQTILIDNKIPPTADPMPEIGPFNCVAEIPANIEHVTGEKANCDGTVTIEHLMDSEYPTCTGSFIRTYRITDECGNFTDLKQKINIEKKIRPQVEPLPDLGPFTCAADIPASDTKLIKIIDPFCSSKYTVEFINDANIPACSGVIVRTYRITDECGNLTDAIQYMIVENKTGPTAAALPDIGPYQCANEIPKPDIALIQDIQANCGLKVTVTFLYDSQDPGCSGAILRSYMMEDECKNQTVVNQIIHIENTEGPGIICPADLTVENSSFVPKAYSSFADFIAGGATITHNCNLNESTFKMKSEQSDGNTNPEVITRIYELEDLCGHVSSCSQTIIVLRDSKPKITAPANINIACKNELPDVFANLQEFYDAGGLVETVCGLNQSSISLVKETTDQILITYISTRVYKIEDICGNSNTFEHILIATDKKNPVFSKIPGSIITACSVPEAFITYADFTSAGGEATDNCEIDPESFILINETDNQNTCPKKISRIYSISDIVGNTVEFTHEITILDTIAPSVSNADKTLLGAKDPIPVSFTTIDQLVTAGAKITDNCQVDPGSFKLKNETTTNFVDSTVIEREYTVADLCNNSSVIGHRIVQSKYFVPYMKPPAYQTIECNEPTPVAFSNYNEFVTSGGIAESTCGINPTSFKMNEETISETSCQKIIIRNYEIKDSCGVSIQATHAITIEDKTAPLLTCPPSLNIDNKQLIPSVINTTDAFILAGGSMSDNCQIDLGSFVFVSEETTIEGNLEIVTRTYQISDACGNTTTCKHLITIANIQTLNANAGDLELECKSEVPLVYTKMEEYTKVGGIVNSPCAIDESTFKLVSEESDLNTCPEIITRVYKINDTCGNQIMRTQRIFIQDITSPEFVNVPGDLTTACEIPQPYKSISEFEAAGGKISDNCDLNKITISLVVNDYIGNTCNLQLHRIYMIKDLCGKTNQYEQYINIKDETAPFLWHSINNIRVDCVIPQPYGSLNEFINSGGLATDNCEIDPASFKLANETITNTNCPKTITRTYQLSDKCGNTANFINTIYLSDNEIPHFVAPPSINLKNNSKIPVAYQSTSSFISAGGVITDNCSLNMQSFMLLSEDIHATAISDSIIRSYQIADFCGNIAIAKHYVTIERDPFVSNPRDMFVDCVDNIPKIYKTFQEFLNDGGRALSSCTFDASTFKLAKETNLGTKCPEIGTRTYEIKDVCNNTFSFSHRVIIDDQIAPQITGTSLIKMNLLTGITEVYKSIEDFEKDGGTISDNCGIRRETFKLVSEKSQLENCPFSVTRVYSITDSCDNQGSFTQVFTIEDQEPPQIKMPADLVIDCIDATPASFINYTDFVVAGGQVTDNTFMEESTFALVNEKIVSGQGTKQIIRSYQIKDRCGNIGTAQHIIQSSDNVAPVASCNPIMISLDANGKYALNTNDILQITLGSHDDCTPIAELKYQISPSSFDCSMIGDIQDLRITVSDGYGNSSECKTTAVVLDNYIPVITCHNIDLFLDENGQALLRPEMIAIIESENCGINTMTVDRAKFSCAEVGKQNVQVTVKDNTNVASCSATVTVIDTIVPRITANTVTLTIDNSGKALLTDALLSAISFDACGISSYEPDRTEFTCADLGKNTVHFKVTDKNFNSASTDLIVMVLAGNLKPQALNDVAATIMDTPIRIAVLTNDKDPNGSLDASSLKVIQLPKHGNIQINSVTKEISYSPDNGFIGNDSLQYVVCDNGIPCITLCDTAVVSISILKPNIAPIAVDDHFMSGCDMINGNVLDNDQDIDGHVLKIKTQLVSSPKHGVVTINENGDFSYTFPYKFSGSDSFVYQVCDNALDAKCTNATVFINIFPDNDCDGIDDSTDLDDDNDGISDAVEGNSSSDMDGDGIPDSKDIDSDNDGILDNTEAQAEGKFIPLSGTDANGNGLDDTYQPSGLAPVDTDADGIPDYLDNDSDDDHVSDHIEGYDFSSTGISSAIASGMDDDKDGLDNAYDLIDARTKNSSFTNPAESNEILQDTDNDKTRDWRDNDDDDDGIKTKFEDLNNNGIFIDDDFDLDNHPDYLDVNSDCTLFIPEGFSPDGDGIHDYFQIYCIDSYPNAKMMIFDRQGNLLYSKDHYGNLEFWGNYEDSWWNGVATMGPNANKKVSPEIYLYIFEFGNGKSQRGFVMVSY